MIPLGEVIAETFLDAAWEMVFRVPDWADQAAIQALDHARSFCAVCGTGTSGRTITRHIDGVDWITRACDHPTCIGTADRLLDQLT